LTYNRIETKHTAVHITRNQKIDLSKLLRSDPWNEKLEDKNTSSPNALTGHHQLLVQYMEQAENFMVNPISSTVLVEEAYHWPKIEHRKVAAPLCSLENITNYASPWICQYSILIEAVFFIPRAIVLAHPAAWRHRRSISNQNAVVGVSARPTHDKMSIARQTKKVGLLPSWSDKGPQAIGAVIAVRILNQATIEEEAKTQQNTYKPPASQDIL